MTVHRRIAFVLGLLLAAALPALAQEPATDPDAGAVALATAVLDRMEAGDFEGASAEFNAQMRAGLDPARLAEVQRQIEQTGPVVERAEPRVLHQDGYTVVVFRIRREQATLDATVAVDGDGMVGGLHFVPAAGGQQ